MEFINEYGFVFVLLVTLLVLVFVSSYAERVMAEKRIDGEPVNVKMTHISTAVIFVATPLIALFIGYHIGAAQAAEITPDAGKSHNAALSEDWHCSLSFDDIVVVDGREMRLNGPEVTCG